MTWKKKSPAANRRRRRRIELVERYLAFPIPAKRTRSLAVWRRYYAALPAPRFEVQVTHAVCEDPDVRVSVKDNVIQVTNLSAAEKEFTAGFFGTLKGG